MTLAPDYPDFIRPVAQAETDTLVYPETQLTGSVAYNLGSFDVSQCQMIRGVLLANIPSGDWVTVTFSWAIGLTVVGQDVFSFPAEADTQFAGRYMFAVRPRAATLYVNVATASAADLITMQILTSTRPGNARELVSTAFAGAVLLDTASITVPAGSTQSFTIPPVARALSIRGKTGGPSGTLTVLANYPKLGSFGQGILYRTSLTANVDVMISELLCSGLFTTVQITNGDTSNRVCNATVLDVS